MSDIIDYDMVELKPCPFCGSSSGRMDYINTKNGYRDFVRCSVCGAQTRLYKYKADAVQAWQVRSGS